MLQVGTTGAYYPPVVTTWKILTTGASYLTTGTLCSGLNLNCAFEGKPLFEMCWFYMGIAQIALYLPPPVKPPTNVLLLDKNISVEK